jgi:hypothetical protein
MTPQELDMRQGRDDILQSTVEMPAVNVNKGVRQTDQPKATQEPNLALLAHNDTQDLRSRWETIQSGFVDEPRKAVEQAHELVASAIKRLAEFFATERQKTTFRRKNFDAPPPLPFVLRSALVRIASPGLSSSRLRRRHHVT